MELNPIQTVTNVLLTVQLVTAKYAHYVSQTTLFQLIKPNVLKYVEIISIPTLIINARLVTQHVYNVTDLIKINALNVL